MEQGHLCKKRRSPQGQVAQDVAREPEYLPADTTRTHTHTQIRKRPNTGPGRRWKGVRTATGMAGGVGVAAAGHVLAGGAVNAVAAAYVLLERRTTKTEKHTDTQPHTRTRMNTWSSSANTGTPGCRKGRKSDAGKAPNDSHTQRPSRRKRNRCNKKGQLTPAGHLFGSLPPPPPALTAHTTTQ